MKGLTQLAVFLPLTACLAGGCSSSDPRRFGTEARVIAFVDVAVIPMTRSEVLRHQTVIVEKGLIAALGPVNQVEVPTDSIRVDGHDRYLLPGLVDMHVHLEHLNDENELLLFLANGVTAVRNMDGRDHILVWRDRQRAGELVGPLIFTSGPLLDGDPPLWDDSVVVKTPEDADRIVNEIAEAGYDQIKVYDRLDPDVHEAIIRAGRARGKKVVGHVPVRAGLARALELGQDSIEHLTGYGNLIDSEASPLYGRWHPHKRFLALISPDEAELEVAVELTVAGGTWNCPTLVMHEKSFVLEGHRQDWKREPGAESVSVLRSLEWTLLNFIDRETATPETIEGARALRYQLVNRLEAAGAELLMGTDAGIPFVIPGFSAHEELQHLVRAGLTPYQALRTATVDAGRFLDRGSTLGSIEPGQRGDLLLLAANPLKDISNTRRLEGVLTSGTWFGPRALQALLAEATW